MKKKNKLKILGAILIILIIGIGIYIWQTKANFLTPIEKEWLAASASKIQNIHVINNENIFGNDGQGLFYTFLKDFQDNYKISLNTITYKNTETVSGALFGASNYIPDDALEFYQDHYIYVTKKKEIVSEISGLRGKKIGVIKNDETLLNNRLAKININITTYNSQEELLQALEDEQVSSIIVPRIEYIDKILANDYYIGYHFSDINYYYYMNDVADSRLKSVMKKYFIDWEKHNLQKELAKEERAIFIKNLKIEEKDLVELQAVDVKYGLVNNSPYELLSGGKVGGIMTEYLKAFANFSGIEILYNRYDNPKKFIKEITNNKIKLYMNYFTQTNNGVEIPTNLTLSYSLYTHETNPLVVLTDASVKDKTIYVEENTLLATVLQQNYGYQIKTYNREKEWNKIIKKKDIILAIDSNMGEYYQKHDLKKFHKIFSETTEATYSLKSMNNDIFNTLISKYILYLDNHKLTSLGTYHNTTTEQNGSVIQTLAKYAFYFLLIIGLILALIYHNSKKVRVSKKIKKDDKLKFIDQLTSLKNRNYLNENISAWNKNTIYPQAVIMLDLNNLQEINDTLGYEEGDKQIQASANILIRSQLDNTDIIRTDGNEFMIYLVGYSAKQITSYIHKLNKEFKTLPYEYGVSIGYSMIENELKNIQDAINECVEDIKKQKEEQKEDSK